MAMSAHVPVPVPPRKPGRIAGAETRNGVPPVALELCLRAPENFGYVYTRAERRNTREFAAWSNLKLMTVIIVIEAHCAGLRKLNGCLTL